MDTDTHKTSARRHLTWAAILQLVQGILMEGLPFIGLGIILLLNISTETLSYGFSFIVPFFNENLYLMMVMSGVFAALRIVGAIGLLKNRMWGYSLSVINCVVTLTLMIFMLPAGVADGIFAGGALVLLLMARYGKKTIIE